MKRVTIFLCLITLGALLATASAYMQTGLRRPGAPADATRKIPAFKELPQTYLNQTRLHKLILTEKDLALYTELAKAGAIRNEVDYGGFKLVVIDEEAIGGRAGLQSLMVAARDDQNLIMLNGHLIDTGDLQQVSKDLPPDLQQSRMSRALAAGVAPGKGLYIVQFIGPIQDAWLRTLAQTGSEVIAYIPNNAYVVSAGESAAGELIRMKAGDSFVQWIGDYQAAYKLAPGLQSAYERGDSQSIRVTVQIIDNAEGDLKANELKASWGQDFRERRVLKYRNITVTMPVSRLAELAQSDEVFAIEEDHRLALQDEAQGQIIAGNLSGNAPRGPGYLAWLASKGFDGSQFGSFAINVVDDGYSLRGHPDLPDSRIAFENNPGNLGGPRGNHGFLNAQIIGGFNDLAGSAYEDAAGFNYGLGIVPWARIGATAIFPCPGGSLTSSPSEWESAAYGQGARISSNSWGGGFPVYDTLAQEYDSIVRDAQHGTTGNQQLTVLFSAGNDGPSDGTVSPPGVAKNIITVGASENVRQTGEDGCRLGNSDADSANDIASFSSRGPIFDGRIKPDIVAPGVHIQAGVPQSNFSDCGVCDRNFPAGQTLYGWSSGTSHSAPAVAGAAALVYQDFLNKGLEPPSPAMIKALLMNSASYMTGVGAGDALPSKSQGMGLVNLGRTFDGTPRLLTDQTKVFGSSGEAYNVLSSVASPDQPVRITLAWTDAPGATISAPWINNLDLEVTINGQVYKGNVFSGERSTPGGLADGRNNVESVYLPAGVSGNFVVTVRASNIAGDGVPGDGDPTDQDFALVVYNANSAAPNLPVIEVTPGNLSFNSVAGVNPGRQVININNIAVGTLNWTANDDAPWLTVSPASGVAPSMLTADVNISGLAIGTYSATITIASANAFNSPIHVPVTLTVFPVFAVDPSSLTFIAAIGGGNPESQTISISNNDSAIPDWTASDDASWLTLTPASGAAPSTLTASVDISGLAIGAYNATITIRSTNPSTPPIKASVSLIVDKIFNGGFERLADPWILSGVAMRSAGANPHSGKGYLILGGANGSKGTAYQQLAIPTGRSTNLTFWLNVTSSDGSITPSDRLWIEVCDRSGRTLAKLAEFSNLDKSTPGGYTLRGGYNLARFAGGTVRIQFRTATDPSSITAFRIDDVSVR